MRLDKYLFENRYYPSREKASIAIKEGLVKVDGKIINKPSFEIEEGNIEIIKPLLDYVSFGGNKLKRAIDYFKLDFQDKIVLDIGSSTGGFTDCALKHGAETVYCVDVGSNQLAESLRKDSRVQVFENTNILDFYVDCDFDYLVMDVSFVSIKKIIPSLLRFMSDETKLVTLIKPQFELGQVKLKNGVVKDDKEHLLVLNDCINFIENLDLKVLDLTYSTQVGKMGNIEFLVLIGKGGKKKPYLTGQVVKEAHSALKNSK